MCIVDKRRTKACWASSDASSDSSKISTHHVLNILDKLKTKRVWDSTNKNYLAIWRVFNKFIIRLDHIPKSWEERTSLFCGYLIEDGVQSQTIKSYVSAIKAVLIDDRYDWCDDKILLTLLTRACKLQNDKVTCRFPISRKLLGLILFELKRILAYQFYQQILFRALFCLAYYGLMRVGELAEGTHLVKAANIHIGTNKNKILYC